MLTSNDLKNKLQLKTPIVIIGLGKSGRSANQLLIKCGYKKNELYLFDEKTQALPQDSLQSWSEFSKLSPGTLVVSPGVPLQHKEIQILVKLGWQLTSEINLACAFITSEKIIGITGSVAKSTVTHLIGLGCTNDYPTTFVGGNIGVPFCEYALNLIDQKPKAHFIVLELSSYQLENCEKLNLEYSVITYLSANHLERYESISEYYLTKCSISKITKNECLLNDSSSDCQNYVNQISSKALLINKTNLESFFPEATTYLKKVKMLGDHNLDNFSLAYSIAKKINLSSNALDKMCEFKGLEHRLEFVDTINGVIYVNDSKATAMDSVIVAAQACQNKLANKTNKLFLLLGGKDKNLPWKDLSFLHLDQQIEIIFFGECGQLAKAKIQSRESIYESQYYPKLKSALDYAADQAKMGDLVLLSPGGTSLDEFKNFEDRGRFFKEFVYSKK